MLTTTLGPPPSCLRETSPVFVYKNGVSSSLYLYYEAASRCIADIDDCSIAPCDINAICEDIGASFTCICNEGYIGDGLVCSGDISSSFRWVNLYYYVVIISVSVLHI